MTNKTVGNMKLITFDDIVKMFKNRNPKLKINNYYVNEDDTVTLELDNNLQMLIEYYENFSDYEILNINYK